MSEDVAIKESRTLEDFTKLQDFSKLEGHGGAFLVTPLDQYKVFSKEQFTILHILIPKFIMTKVNFYNTILL